MKVRAGILAAIVALGVIASLALFLDQAPTEIVAACVSGIVALGMNLIRES